MTHVRTLIRMAVETRLTGLPTTAGNLERASPHPVAPGRLPALRVTTPAETSGTGAVSPVALPVLDRTVTVAIAIFALAGDDIEDVLDGIVAEVETAIFSDDTWSGLAVGSTLTGTRLSVGEKAERRSGMAELTLDVFYRTAEGAPEAAA